MKSKAYLVDCRIWRVFIETIIYSENFGVLHSFQNGMRYILKTWNTKDLKVIQFYINDIFEFLCAVSNKMTLHVYLLYFHVKCGRKYHYINYLRKNTSMTEMKI